MSDLAIAYNGLSLDRAGKHRADPEWLAEVRERAGSTVLALWRDRCLVRDGVPVVLPPAVGHWGGAWQLDGAGHWGEAGRLGAVGDRVVGDDPVGRAGAAGNGARAGSPGGRELVFLALDGDCGRFAVDLSDVDEAEALRLSGAESAVDVRALFPVLSATESSLLAYAKGILHWHRGQRFCGACGHGTEVREGGHLRVCGAVGCGRLLFPRIEPAVIVLVTAPDAPRRCLLGRHRGAAEGAFSTLAGFVEIGESLEDAVRREVAEEAGVAVGPVRYLASQAWPFPAGLMVGFQATAVDAAIAVDEQELIEARWFTAAEIRARVAADPAAFRVDSIGHHLIADWLAAD
ncbi:NAD(+) diphosphatase [Crossiella sp. CA198]|uniref:NAD(+) diphosphatase n=1 Tax=Crossiella sp. CA198 TaxID=3455607 RepID=UPI003F8D2EE5